MNKDRDYRQLAAEWRDVVLVCRKCAKKLDGGFGPEADETLSKALRHVLDEGERRKVKARRRQVAVMEVGCLDICPKKAVVVVKGSDPGRLLLVPEGADLADLIDRLALRPNPNPADGTPERSVA